MTDRLANAQERAIKMLDTTFVMCYQEGFDDGYKDGTQNPSSMGFDHGYERGLNDAWECARKIIHMTDEEKDNCFGIIGESCYFDLSTASECIAKIKEYEEKQKADEIRIGDEVDHDGLKCVVVKVWQDCVCTISQVGTTPSYTDKSVLKKTGRHFDGIEKLMKELGDKE